MQPKNSPSKKNTGFITQSNSAVKVEVHCTDRYYTGEFVTNSVDDGHGFLVQFLRLTASIYKHEHAEHDRKY